jgi:hypothetical protein
MTGGPPRKYTELDTLKQLTAQGLISAAAIEKVLEEQSASPPKETKLAIAHARVLQAILITAQTAHVAGSDDPDHYSDGRPVVSTIDAGGQTFKHVWYADPDHPLNHPAPDQPSVALVMTSTGQVWKLFIAAPNELGAIELGDEEQDRL